MMDQAQLLRLIAALQAQGQGPPPPSGAASAAQTVLAALLGRRPAGTSAPPPLSPIDRMLGGEMLVGKKTAIAVLGLAVLVMFNPGVLAGNAAVGIAPKITATLLKGLGGLGLLAKFDRVIAALGMIATTPQARAATDAVLRQLLAALAAAQARPAPPPVPLPVPRRVPLPLPPVPLPPPRPVPAPAPAPVPLPRRRPEAAPAGRAIIVTGKMSTFGGPGDRGVAANEGLALVEPSQMGLLGDCFLPTQPQGTSGLARRLDPEAAYIACRWNYKMTSKAYLRAVKVEVINPRTGQKEWAQPVDWGPHERTGRVADLSPGLARRLGLRTDDGCRVLIPLPAGIEAPPLPDEGKPEQTGNGTIWVVSAAADIGTHEISGPKVNQTILAALDWADGGKDGHYIQSIDDDETPWCSSWLCGKFEMVGIKSPRSAWAQSWANWGQRLKGPAVGCVVVFRWSAKAGHVGIVVGRTPSGSLMVLGGNQSDAVNVKAFSIGKVLAYCWPKGFDRPTSTGMGHLPVTSQDQVVTSFKDTR